VEILEIPMLFEHAVEIPMLQKLLVTQNRNGLNL